MRGRSFFLVGGVPSLLGIQGKSWFRSESDGEEEFPGRVGQSGREKEGDEHLVGLVVDAPGGRFGRFHPPPQGEADGGEGEEVDRSQGGRRGDQDGHALLPLLVDGDVLGGRAGPQEGFGQCVQVDAPVRAPGHELADGVDGVRGVEQRSSPGEGVGGLAVRIPVRVATAHRLRPEFVQMWS